MVKIGKFWGSSQPAPAPPQPALVPAPPPAPAPAQPAQASAPTRFQPTRAAAQKSSQATTQMLQAGSKKAPKAMAEGDEINLDEANAYLNEVTVEFAGLATDPLTVAEAMQRTDAPNWSKAIEKENASLSINNTWTWVKMSDLPPGTKPLHSKYVLRIKPDEHGNIKEYKARLVVKGYEQRAGIDYDTTYAPVTTYTTVRTLLAAAAANGWHVHHMDVSTAFLNAHIDADVYMYLPDGYSHTDDNGEQLICKLNKSLYGLKQAPHLWNEELTRFMCDTAKLTQSKTDPCMFNNKNITDVIFVDDMLIAAPDISDIEAFKKAITDTYRCTDEGPVHWFLGMRIERSDGGILLSQEVYADKVLQRFGMSDASIKQTPLTTSKTPFVNDGESTKMADYRAIVGSLAYLSLCTRPDLSFAVNWLSRALENPTPAHLMAAKRTLRYLNGTRSVGILMPANGDNVVRGFVDSDHGGDTKTGRSTTGMVFFLGDSGISWRSKLQTCVAPSSAEAEYIAACAAAKEAAFLRKICADMGMQQETATDLFEDNSACRQMAAKPSLTTRNKHIRIQFHYLRDAVKDGDVKLMEITTGEQLADGLTKPVNRLILAKLIEAFNGRGLPT